MAWVEIMPGYASMFRKWNTAAAFLSWTGILVNRHRHRQVERVSLNPDGTAQDVATLAGVSCTGTQFYVKKEFAVTWRDRLRNAWDGFGWCATAVREAAMLQALRRANIGCPEVIALGEDGRSAFVLTRAASNMTELRAILPTLTVEAHNQLADALGHELAKIHNAGFEHPDLFAKHILAGAEGTTFRFCILDWQRGRHRRYAPWSVRCRQLAILDATLHHALASDRLRIRCLRAYCRATSSPPPLGRLARRIRRLAQVLRLNRNIREVGQLPVPAGDQEFVPLDGGRKLVVRSHHEELAGMPLDASSPGVVEKTWPAGGSALEIPELAHTLFRLQRFGVPAPRLRAVGLRGDRIFLHAFIGTTVPLIEAIAKASATVREGLLVRAGAIVRRIHDAGYCLPVGDSWGHRLGVAADMNTVILATADALVRTRTAWNELGPHEFAAETAPWSDIDHVCFLRGYLGAPAISQGDPERQVAL